MARYKIKEVGEYKIELEEFDNTFFVSELDTETNEYNELKSFQNLSEAEKYIEKREERLAKGKIKNKEPLQILHKKYSSDKSDNYRDARITSVDGGNVWIVNIENGSRSKEYGLSDKVKNTEANKERLNQIKELNAKIKEITSSLEKYTEAEIKKHFEINIGD